MVNQGRQSSFGLPLLVGLVAIVAAFAGSASILDRTTATRAAVDGAQRVTLADDGAVRRKVRCAGCGVVESVRRIDRREVAGGVCTIAGSDRLQIMGNADGGDEYGGVATLADTVDGVLAGRPGAVRMKVTSTFQIVVRFRDGSRHVFNEATARALRSGERIQVIAGLELPAV